MTTQPEKLALRDAGSFRDPAGCIFYFGGKVYRHIEKESACFTKNLVNSALFDDLVGRGMVIPTRVVEGATSDELANALRVTGGLFLEHDKIEILNYPFEWSTAMCIDAAVLTLEIQEILLQHGLSLKDATPYNVQFVGSHPVFIDVPSIETCSTTGIWQAYNQFCELWLYPVLLHRKSHLDLRSIYCGYPEGLPLVTARTALGSWPAWRYGVIMDYGVPALLSTSKRVQNKITTGLDIPEVRESSRFQLATARRCRKVMTRLRPERMHSQWTSYATQNSYTENDSQTKRTFVETVLRREQVRTVLDIGCNTGFYSKLAAHSDCKVVALDIENECIDQVYRTAKTDGLTILPICASIANPSPGLGWNNSERPALLDRLRHKFECVLSLAVVHHLLIRHRIPLEYIAQLHNDLTNRLAIIEFVGTRDRMFAKLLQYRSESYTNYTLELFKAAFGRFFHIREEARLANDEAGTDRALLLMEKRSG